jgi:hypothetical protein
MVILKKKKLHIYKKKRKRKGISFFCSNYLLFFFNMRLLIITLLGIAISLVQADSSFSSQTSHETTSSDATLQSQSANLQPVAYTFQKRPQLKVKRDYALALEYLKTATDSYRKRSVNPIPVGYVELGKTITEAPLEGALAKEPSAAIENGIPLKADIEEDDEFDPEEDPDDVDDPPIVNGVAVSREE